MKLLTVLAVLLPTFGHSLSLGSGGDDLSLHGTVRTQDTVFEGELRVNFEQSTIIVKNANQYQQLSARMILSAETQDDTYMGLEFDGGHYLFEVLYSGSRVLVFRDNLKYRYSDTPEEFLPFFFVENGIPVPVYKLKDLLEVFGNDEKWMSVFIKNSKLDVAIVADLKAALAYYDETRL